MKRNRLKYQSPPAPAAPGPPPTSKPRRGLANGAGSRGCRLPLLKCDLFFFPFQQRKRKGWALADGRGRAAEKTLLCRALRVWLCRREPILGGHGREPPPHAKSARKGARAASSASSASCGLRFPPLGSQARSLAGHLGPRGALVRTQFTREKAERPPTFRQSEEPGTSRPLGGGRGGGQVNRSGLGSCVFLPGRLLTLETGLIGGSGRALRSGPGSVLVAESHLARHSPGKLSHRGGIHLPSIPTGEQAMHTVLVKRKHVQWPNYPKKHSARLNVSCVFVMTFNTCKIFFFVKT